MSEIMEIDQQSRTKFKAKVKVKVIQEEKVQPRVQKSCCDICVSDFNVSSRLAVRCPKCNINCCRSCISTYLLERHDDPHCMSCRIPWDRRFLVTNMTKSFVFKQYKDHRQNIILQRQRALLPSTLEFIELEQAKPELIAEFTAVVVKLDAQKNSLYASIREMQKNINELNTLTNTAQSKLNRQLGAVSRKRNEFSRRAYEELAGIQQETEVVAEEEKKDDKPDNSPQFASRGMCPREDCNGLIMKGWICTCCGLKKCKSCYEPEDFGEGGSKIHVCDETMVASIRSVKHDSKPCPGCRAMIHRIMGCPQMFCIQCHTFFDYRNGEKLDPKHAHNPEHNRLVREGQIVGNRYSRFGQFNRDTTRIIVWAREFHDYAEAHFRKNIRKFSLITLDLRLDFLRGKITEGFWKKKAQEVDKKTFFHRDAYELSLTFANTVGMLTNQPCFYDRENIETSQTTIQALRASFREQKDELCVWFGYRTRRLLAEVGGGRNGGRQASYNM